MNNYTQKNNITNISLKEDNRHGNVLLPINAYEWWGDGKLKISLNQHMHKEWEIFRIIDGYATCIVDDDKYVVNKNEYIFIYKNQIHHCESLNECNYRYQSVVFDPSILFSLSGDIVQTKYVMPLIEHIYRIDTFMPIKNKEFNNSFEKLLKIIFEKKPYYELKVKSILFEIMAYIIENYSNHNSMDDDLIIIYHSKKIKNTIKYIEDNYAKHIMVKDLADMCNVSTSYYSRLFKHMTNYSPIEYLLRVRLSKAANLLTESNIKIISISMNTGFNNTSYFIRAFQKYFGCTPNEFRRKNKKY